MQICSFIAFWSCHVAIASALNIPSHTIEKRKAMTNATLVAYGTNSEGWPVSYNTTDGLLYIASRGNITTSTDLTSITFDIAAITGENWIANGTLANGTEAGAIYIQPENGFQAVGVKDIAAVTVLGDGSKTTGFAMFAKQLTYNSGGDLESQFWAQSTATDGVYALMWNSAGSSQTESFPVIIKGSEDS